VQGAASEGGISFLEGIGSYNFGSVLLNGESIRVKNLPLSQKRERNTAGEDLNSAVHPRKV